MFARITNAILIVAALVVTAMAGGASLRGF